MLGSVTSELDKLSPRFEVEPSQIQILKSPSDFYETLKVRSRSILHISIHLSSQTSYQLDLTLTMVK